MWFGDNPGQNDPGFQIYFLDDNAYGREIDKSFWVKGESRAEFLIKYATGQPGDSVGRHATQAARADAQPGSAADRVRATVNGRTQQVDLTGDAADLVQPAIAGFWYQARAYVWVVSVSSSTGFVPIFNGADATTASSACASSRCSVE